jgi:hypothetical protein
MPLSSKTLFHFTNSSDALVSILRHEFRPRYCLEDFRWVIGDQMGDSDLAVAIPMVCFCDIPLSQTAAHMSTYGNYAIGLTKSWGTQHAISPVLYAYPRSATSDAYVQLHISNEALKGTLDDHADFSGETERFLCFMKPYRGPLVRSGITIDEVIFYDEREWRYVPKGDWKGLSRSAFADDTQRRRANDTAWDSFRISFDPPDIRYIVVAGEAEIEPMIRSIKTIKGDRYTLNQIDVLCSRIVCASAIRDDF